MNVLITGGNGKVGTAITDHLGDDKYDYAFSILDLETNPDYPTTEASVADYEAIRPAFDGIDAVIHLAVYPPGLLDGNWEKIEEVNIQGTRNVLEACREAGVPQVIFASTNHTMGMYEEDNVPDIYGSNRNLVLDHKDPVRPDSYYGVSKLFGEKLGRFYVEKKRALAQFYAVRICSLRSEEYDHPYGDAERAVHDGEIERHSEEYERLVNRMKAMWFSRRDCAHMVDRLLHDEAVSFDIFYGVSGNSRRFHDIDHAKERIGYNPKDDGEGYDSPPGIK